jgi:hypothetical protein
MISYTRVYVHVRPEPSFSPPVSGHLPPKLDDACVGASRALCRPHARCEVTPPQRSYAHAVFPLPPLATSCPPQRGQGQHIDAKGPPHQLGPLIPTRR